MAFTVYIARRINGIESKRNVECLSEEGWRALINAERANLGNAQVYHATNYAGIISRDLQNAAALSR